MKKKLVLAALIAVAVVLPVTASASEFTADVYAAGVTKYLWRGQLLNDGFAIQPGFNIGLGGITLGFWGSYHLGSSEFAEADLTVSYSDTVPGLDMVKLSTGFIVYTFPYVTPSLGNNSTEIFAGISADVISAPYVKFFYDTVAGAGGYLEAGLSHSMDFSPVTAGASVTCGYNFGQWGYDKSLTVIAGTLSISYPILEKLTVAASLTGQLALDAHYLNDGFGTISAAYGF